MDPITEEQQYVDQAYRRLDELIAQYRHELAAIRLTGDRDNPVDAFQRDSFAATYEDELNRLSHVRHQLVLGRLDDADGGSHHIGRIGLRDANHEVLLLDWRAPQASAFYRATAKHPLGMIRRRHIQTRGRTVTSVEDELLTSETAKISRLSLTGEGALLASLGRARDASMGDIVSTIQAEQDRIIRADGDGVLLVQGGPGTGKTAVALHRAAYLLYAQRARLARSGVLILGPSASFLSYISKVLPSLGESGVVSTTIAQLLPGVTPTGTDDAQATEIKGRLAWEKIARRAVRYLVRPLSSPVKVRVASVNLEITPEMIERAQAVARRTGRAHNAAWATYAKTIIAELAGAYERQAEGGDWLTADIASTDEVRRTVNSHWLPATPRWLLDHLLAHPDLLSRLAPELTAQDIAAITRPRGSELTEADIPLLDELAELLGETPRAPREDDDLEKYAEAAISGMNLGGGIVDAAMLAERMRPARAHEPLAVRAARDRTWTYGHIVVDEAQELSPLAWRMVGRRCPAHSLTIVGDLDQRPGGAPEGGWPALLGPLAKKMRQEVLTISYRTPAEVLAAAEEAMAVRGIELAHPVSPVRSVDGSLRTAATLDEAIESELAFLDEHYGAGRGLLAIIAENPPSIDHPQVHVMTPREAKGLEYDSVILPGPIRAPGDLYVAMTRPTQHLVLVEGEHREATDRR
ncbi:MAG: AAA family ATPase [Flaviflexus sp.]|nr:AAA family ATPase [Flaviflexus sp.]